MFWFHIVRMIYGSSFSLFVLDKRNLGSMVESAVEVGKTEVVLMWGHMQQWMEREAANYSSQGGKLVP